MTQDDLSFLPLRVTRVGVGGKRSFDPVDKRRLIEACLQPGATLSGLALKAGVNANQLRKWVESRATERPCAFVPVVAVDDRSTVPAPVPATRPAPIEASQRPSRSAAAVRLAAHLPNGVKLEIECAADTGLLAALVAALGTR